MRCGVKPACGRAIAIARSFEKRICDCWQLCAAKIVTPSSRTNASTPRRVSRAGCFGGSSGRVDAYADRTLLHGVRRYGMNGQAV